MKKYLAISLLLFVSTAANCQLITDSILVAQHYRTFSYFKPAAKLKNGSLMFVMHGSGGSGKDMFSRTTKLESVAAKEKLLVVYPDGYQYFWNECRKYSDAVANKENINENDFFTGMINYFADRYGIDKDKVFASGTSGGGHMAYKLAFTMPDKVRAIAAVIANMPDSASCDCTLAGKALPVLIINGTADKVNPFNGGEMFVFKTSFGTVLSTEKTFSYWSQLAGYKGDPKKEMLPDTDPNDHRLIERYSFNESGKPAVSLLKVIGGGHDYPNDIDVFMYAWEFFKQSL